ELSASYTPSHIPVPWDNIIGPLLLASSDSIHPSLLDSYLDEIPAVPISPNCTSIILMADGAAEGPMGSNKDDARLGCGVAVFEESNVICGYQWTPFGGVIGTNNQAESFSIIMACLLAAKIRLASTTIAIGIQTDSEVWTKW